MSCEDFEDDVVDLARGEELGDAERAEALAHAEGCLRCAARLDDERAVTSGLRAFAARTAGAEAPPRVEAALLRALRDPQGVEGSGTATASPSRGVELLLLAAAAAILAAIMVVPPRGGSLSEPAFPTADSPATVAGGDAAAAAAGENADFVALSYGEDLRELDSVQVVSVELPRTALAALGWPGADSAQTGSVKADVIVGHDGVARAIRFLD
ncbi:MAG TPA: hypothetical protein VGN09_03360 [Vicinamibacteria bacterium]|jgi:hypothetical protein